MTGANGYRRRLRARQRRGIGFINTEVGEWRPGSRSDRWEQCPRPAQRRWWSPDFADRLPNGTTGRGPLRDRGTAWPGLLGRSRSVFRRGHGCLGHRVGAPGERGLDAADGVRLDAQAPALLLVFKISLSGFRAAMFTRGPSPVSREFG